ncbi:MAG TPA: hypothetical protein VF610_13600 [Segetibacter sp.]|jgi:hypothetical protein
MKALFLFSLMVAALAAEAQGRYQQYYSEPANIRVGASIGAGRIGGATYLGGEGVLGVQQNDFLFSVAMKLYSQSLNNKVPGIIELRTGYTIPTRTEFYVGGGYHFADTDVKNNPAKGFKVACGIIQHFQKFGIITLGKSGGLYSLKIGMLLYR